MKLLFTSDWHADRKSAGRARFGDVDVAVRQMVKAAGEQKVDAFFFLGDLCDPDAGSSAFRAVELAISTAIALQDAGIWSYWLAGNHDVIEDGSGDTTLSPMRPLVGRDTLVRLFESPGEHYLLESTNIRLVALPYTATDRRYSPADRWHDVGSGDVTIVIGHLAVAGVEPGEETSEMPRGRDVLFPRECFPEHLRNVHCFNGHYHRQQTHELAGFRPVHIPGSPARFTHGERDHVPGYLIVEV